MRTIQTNKLGLDVVDIQVECTGNSQTDMFFQEPVLDHERDYVLGVSEISVPLAGEHPITTDSILLQETMIELKKKRTLAGMLPFGHGDTTIANNIARFRLKERLVNSPADLVHNIALYLYGIQEYLNSLTTNTGSLRGDNPDYTLSAYTTPSGILRIRASAAFWADYCFVLSDFGNELLGYIDEQNTVGLVKPLGGEMTMLNLVTGDDNVFVEMDNNVTDSLEIPFIDSIFRYAENRLRLEIDADLAIPSNILVENGIHKLHYNIASYAIPHSFTASGTIDTNPVVNAGIVHESHVYVGNALIKSKDTPTTDWYKLMSAANVQNMRLHIIVVRRVWNRDTKKWQLTRDKLKMSKNSTWFATLKFVEQF